MSTYQERIDTVRKYFQSLKANRYPFVNETLAEKDEYTKSLYFRLLCTLVRYTCEPNQMQVLYIERLIAGCKAEQKYRDYMRMALELEIKDVEEFVSALKETELKYYFCIDGSILLMLSNSDDKNYELLAEIVEIFGITRQEVQYLALASRAIVAQNSTMFEDAQKQSPESMSSLFLFPYIANFHTGLVINDRKIFHMYSYEKSYVDLSRFSSVTSQTVILDNSIISLQKNISFEDCDTVIFRDCNFDLNEFCLLFHRVNLVSFENCTFAGGKKRPITFDICSEVQILMCTFKGFSSQTIKEENVEKIIIKDSSFNDCIYEHQSFSHNWMSKGCVIYSSNPDVLGFNYFQNCYFINCGGKNLRNHHLTNFISNCKGKLVNCFFENCWHYTEGRRDPDDSRRRMFTSDTEVENCQVVNSANIT